jgi:hypothetical protein
MVLLSWLEEGRTEMDRGNAADVNIALQRCAAAKFGSLQGHPA